MKMGYGLCLWFPWYTFNLAMMMFLFMLIGYLKLALQREITNVFFCTCAYIGLEENVGPASCEDSISH
jgi:hypothetical protein